MCRLAAADLVLGDDQLLCTGWVTSQLLACSSILKRGLHAGAAVTLILRAALCLKAVLTLTVSAVQQWVVENSSLYMIMWSLRWWHGKHCDPQQ
jgi:hypothetical protein